MIRPYAQRSAHSNPLTSSRKINGEHTLALAHTSHTHTLSLSHCCDALDNVILWPNRKLCRHLCCWDNNTEAMRNAENKCVWYVYRRPTTSSHSWRTENEIHTSRARAHERERERARTMKRDKEKIIWFDAEVDTCKYALLLTDWLSSEANGRTTRNKTKNKSKKIDLCPLFLALKLFTFSRWLTDWFGVAATCAVCTPSPKRGMHTQFKNRQTNWI